jgi:HK97 family phage prohead protease
METLEKFKSQREPLDKVVSLPIEQERAKFEVNENDRTVKGYAIVWGSKNSYNEIVTKGATLNSLNARGIGSEGKNKIVLLKQHNMAEPIGNITVLREDDYGLYFEAEIISGTKAADEALAEIQQGVLRQLSYGFSYIWDKTEYNEDEDAFILREIKLFEISLVTFSADENAQLRSFAEYQINQQINKFSIRELSEMQKLIRLKLESRDEHFEEKETEKPNSNNKVNFF